MLGLALSFATLFVLFFLSRSWSDVLAFWGWRRSEPVTDPCRTEEQTQARILFFREQAEEMGLEAERLVAQIETHEDRLRKAKSDFAAFVQAARPLLPPAFMIVLFASFIAAYRWHGGMSRPGHMLSFDRHLLSFVVASALFYAPMYLCRWLLPMAEWLVPYSSNRVRAFCFVLWPVLMTGLYGFLVMDDMQGHERFHLYASGVFAVLCSALAILIFSLFLIENQAGRNCPDSGLVHGLLDILYRVKQEAPEWTKADFRVQIAARLEAAAVCMEFDLTRKLRGLDVVTDAWMRGQARRIASGLRAKKRWLLTPRPESRDRFIEQMSIALNHAARGEWDGLLKLEEPENRTPAEERRSGLKSWLGTLLEAVLPGALLFAYYRLFHAGHSGGASPPEYMIYGSAIWATFTLLGTLDPLINARISAFREVVQMFTVPGKR
jgi:hypothetical protein